MKQPSVYFAAEPRKTKVPKRSLDAGLNHKKNPTKNLLPPAQLEDPKPSRKSKKNLGSSMLFALGALTFWQLPVVSDWFHEVAHQEATTSEFTISQHSPGELLNPSEVVENPEQFPVLKDVWHGVARLDNTIQSNSASRGYFQIVEWMLQFEALLLMLPIARNMLRKNISPEAFFEDLHRQGFRGHGLKLGIVGEGVRSTKNLAKSRISIYSKEKLNPEDNKKQKDPLTDMLGEFLKQNGQEDFDRLLKLHDPLGRDTAIANMVGQAVPEASVVSAYQRPGPDRDKFLTAMYEILRMPEASNAEKAAHFFKPLVQSFADSLRLIIDKGANVAVVPESLDPFNNIMIVKGMLGAFEFSQVGLIRKLLNTTKPFTLTPKDQTKLLAFMKYLSFDLPKENVDWFKSKHWDDVLKPWKDVLDYAASKNVPVLIPAGDAWSQDDPRPNAVANTNMLGLLEHPALMMIGGVKSNGKVTRYTSEGGRKYHPFISGNGHGEITSTTEVSVEPSPRMLFIIGEPSHHIRKKFQYKNPIGTPFACGDIASVILMMKQFYPDISVEEVKDILSQTAGDADGVPELIDFLQSGLSSLTYGLWRSKEKLKTTIDPVNMVRFIETLEEKLNEVLNDPIKASVIAHQIGDFDLHFKRNLLSRRPSGKEELLRLTLEQETWNAITPDEIEQVKRVCNEVTANFEMQDVSPEDIIEARTVRKGNKTVSRRAAVYETIRRVKEKQGTIPAIEAVAQNN